ncbi:MAG: alpha/beta hydrolase [Lachnospiraceae bacterium]|nr:alpha/beta hydrolase [Lachnospiraceae bacterium]
MEREDAKRTIGNIRIQMIENVRRQIERRHIHGEEIKVVVNGKPRRLLHYKSSTENPPVYFDIHGGGFAWGMVEEGDLFCHQICEQLGFEVYELDYPLVPDVEYPHSLEWLYETIYYLWEHCDEYHFDQEKMVIGGRSAGGNLAAAMCLLAKDRKQFQFLCQVLDHPYLDLCGIIATEERYMGKEALSQEFMEIIATAYATQEGRKEYLCSPLNAAQEQLKSLPPAVIQTCELDYLRPDGDLYGLRLQDAGVPVRMHCYPDVTHGFTEVEGPDEKKGQQWLIEGIRQFVEQH